MSRRFVSAALLLCASAGVLAQQTPAAQRPAVFRAGANAILVDVYPMKDGRILKNLEPGDFTIKEDGVVQKIEHVEFVDVEPFTPEAEKRDPNTQEEGNTLAADPKNRVFVVYLDIPHVSYEGAYRTRQPLVQALNRILAPNDLFGVMTTDMRARDLVFGRKVLTTEDMLSRYWFWGRRDTILRTPEEQVLEYCTRDPQSGELLRARDGASDRPLVDILLDRQREDKVLTHLESVVDYLGTIRETRTSLLVFTEGWVLFEPDQSLLMPVQNLAGYPKTPAMGSMPGGRIGIATRPEQGSPAACLSEVRRLSELSDRSRYRALIQRAARANVVFYPVNPLGLAVFDFPINADIAPGPDPRQSMLMWNLDRVRGREDALREAAENTGGIAVVSNNKLEAGLDRISNQLAAYYVISYYSTNPKNDGGFRKIDVSVKVPGVSLTARRGYRALTAAEAATRDAPPPVVAPDVAARADAISGAIGALATIRPSAELYGAAVLTKSGELSVTAELSPTVIEAGRFKDGADITLIVTTPSGEPVTQGRMRLGAGASGAAVKVPVPATATGPLQVQLRLRSDDDRADTTTETPRGVEGPLAGPLWFRAGPGTALPPRPAATALFRRTERVHLEWTSSAALASRTARLLDRTGAPLPVEVTLSEKPGAVLAADVNLAPLGPGDYLIELTVTPEGGKPSTQLLALRVRN